MENIDAIIYTKNVMNGLDEEDFFSLVDPFVEKEPLYEEILKLATKNIIDFGEPTLNEEQFDEAINSVRVKAIGDTFDDLVQNGLVDMKGINKDGEFVYALAETPNKILKNKKKI